MYSLIQFNSISLIIAKCINILWRLVQIESDMEQVDAHSYLKIIVEVNLFLRAVVSA